MGIKPEVLLEVLDAADPTDVDFIFDGLRQYNEQFHPIDHRSLYVFIRDEAGVLVGGLLGDTYWGWLSINIVWIEERYRGQGYGQRLLAVAEEEARRRGCVHVHLDTLSFQARPFYEKLGYRVYGTLEDFPAGGEHERYYMTKDL
jgi:GNAT superfamily N-acetyltransferase